MSLYTSHLVSRNSNRKKLVHDEFIRGKVLACERQTPVRWFLLRLLGKQGARQRRGQNPAVVGHRNAGINWYDIAGAGSETWMDGWMDSSSSEQTHRRICIRWRNVWKQKRQPLRWLGRSRTFEEMQKRVNGIVLCSRKRKKRLDLAQSDEYTCAHHLKTAFVQPAEQRIRLRISRAKDSPRSRGKRGVIMIFKSHSRSSVWGFSFGA